MLNRSYRVVLSYLKETSFEKKKDVLMNIVEEIKKRVIKNKSDLLDLFKTENISDRDVSSIIQKQINQGKDFKDYLIYLGESNEGIGYIPNSWFYRNLEDRDIKTRLPLKYWHLVRKPEWIEKNKRY